MQVLRQADCTGLQPIVSVPCVDMLKRRDESRDQCGYEGDGENRYCNTLAFWSLCMKQLSSANELTLDGLVS
jgi:hypothetical protein